MKDQAIAQFRSIYNYEPAVVTRAPGRIEFIGNHTDYNGGTVFGASIDRGVTVAVAPRNDGICRFYSKFSGKVITLQSISLPLKQTGDASWLNYPLGVIAALGAFGFSAPTGFDYLAESDLPAGAGLSSSAALELSSALAFLAITRQNADRETVVKIGKYAENSFVGVPCGILDQGVSGFGKRDHLVYIDCRGPRFETFPLGEGAHFWIFNTHTKHALVDGLYAARHRECMAAAKSLGVQLLADATADLLSASISKLDANEARRAKHIIDEIKRVSDVKAALLTGDLNSIGRLLTASHKSSQNLFENSTPELDLLVDLLASEPHVYGARLTGGGFGGAVMALTDESFDGKIAAEVSLKYQERFGSTPEVIHCQTGNGALVL